MIKDFISILLLFFCTSIFAQIDYILPIPQTVEYDKSKAMLGKKLFFDPILSRDGTVSCGSCHILELGGADGMALSVGIDGQLGNINSPTVFNSVFNFRQFWDGRAKDLQEQALAPIENPVEMGHNFDNLIPILNNSIYRAIFFEIYQEPLNKYQIGEVLAEYEKILITPNAPFDKYLLGEKDAISAEAEAGYILFKSKGCVVCHHGVNVGGNLYSRIGIIKPTPEGSTLGRYEVTKKEKDKYLVKVPTLRNIAKTAPYFHHGKVQNLKDAIVDMADFQLGTDLTPRQIDSIAKFLESLSGEIMYEAKP